jgi:hypothetical protein
MPPVKVVIGHVLVEGNAPRPNALKVVVTGAFGRVGGDILSAADGSFRLVLPEGDCSIALDTASLPAGYTLRSWQYGSANLIKNPKIRVAAADTTELQAVMAVTTAQVTMKLPDGSELLARPPEPNVSVTVTGRVTGIEPVSAPWTVYLTGGRTIGDSPSRSQLRRDGAFEFKKVTQGHYDLMGMLNGPTIRVSLRSIDVAEKDLTNVEAAVPHLKTASGRMVVEGNGPMPLAYSFGLDIGKGAPMAVSVVPDCDGSFVARLPEGSHSVSTSLPPQYVKAFTYGAADLLRGTLQVSASDNAELRITLAANTTVGRGLIGSVSMNSSQIFPALDFGPRTCPAPK